MLKLKSVLILLVFASSLYCQMNPLSQTPVRNYSIDNFTGDLYFAELFRDDIWKVNLKTNEFTHTDFISLPVFANKSHKAIYIDYGKRTAFLYDFDTKTTFSFPESIYVSTSPDAYFSPNDKKVIINDYVYDFATKKYYFDNYATSPLFENAVWASDSSVIITSGYDLIEYFPDSKRSDTLVYADSYKRVGRYAYSYTQDRLYYSTTDSPADFTLYAYDKKTKASTLLYSFSKSETSGNAIVCRSMTWSPGEKMLGFIGYWYTLASADLFVYHPDSNKVFRLTNMSNISDTKYNLNWYESKTFFFLNGRNKLLYRYNLPQNITSIEGEMEIPESFTLSNYPNPFNSSTVISFSSPENSRAELSIFNSLGQLVRAFSPRETEKNENVRLQWNGEDDFGRQVSSGIYYALLRINAENNCYLKTIKLVLIK